MGDCEILRVDARRRALCGGDHLVGLVAEPLRDMPTSSNNASGEDAERVRPTPRLLVHGDDYDRGARRC